MKFRKKKPEKPVPMYSRKIIEKMFKKITEKC